MSELQRQAPLPPPPPRAATAALALAATATCFAAGLGVAAALVHQPAAATADACALPAGIDLAAMSGHDRSVAVRHAILCTDLEHHRIAPADFRARLLATLDAAPPPEPLPAIVWASSVRDASSQYSPNQWSAARALGAPDVYPSSGDNVGAWAPLAADAAVEHLEVGFEQARRLRGLEIYETLNPGAISQVELIGADGTRRTVYAGDAHAMGVPAFKRRIDFACTGEPVVGVRVTLASGAVPGWNEIDAIGAVPCR